MNVGFYVRVKLPFGKVYIASKPKQNNKSMQDPRLQEAASPSNLAHVASLKGVKLQHHCKQINTKLSRVNSFCSFTSWFGLRLSLQLDDADTLAVASR